MYTGEVERLLREYRQNQELVRNIGAHYYQIIYPVQLRHHEKMGISTREVNTPKVSLIDRTRFLDLSCPCAIENVKRDVFLDEELIVIMQDDTFQDKLNHY